MPKIVRARPRASDWWPALLMGAAIGAATSWLMLRRDEPSLDPDELAVEEEPIERPIPRRERRRHQREINLDALAGRLRTHPGTEALRVHSLGQGIVELIGNASVGLDVAAVVKSLAEEPGVSVVVNRVWTPDSATLT